MRLSIQKVLFTLVLALGLAGFVSAQSVDEAGEALNKAIQLQKAENFEGAAQAFQETIDIASMAGPEAFNIQSNAEKQLPLMHFKAAAALYKQKKYLAAADKFKLASDIAGQYNNADLQEKAGKNVPKLYNAIGNSHRKKKNFDKAIEFFDKAAAFKPDYSNAYLGKMLVYKDQGDDANMIAMADKINDLNNSAKSMKSANGIVRTFYLKKAKSANDAKKGAEALKNIEKYMSYGEPDAQGLYLAAVVYNANSKFDKAAAAANKGVTATDDAKLLGNIFFELGNAYKGLNKTTEACSAYSKALNGSNGEAAKYQMEEVLGCN